MMGADLLVHPAFPLDLVALEGLGDQAGRGELGLGRPGAELRVAAGRGVHLVARGQSGVEPRVVHRHLFALNVHGVLFRAAADPLGSHLGPVGQDLAEADRRRRSAG